MKILYYIFAAFLCIFFIAACSTGPSVKKMGLKEKEAYDFSCRYLAHFTELNSDGLSDYCTPDAYIIAGWTLKEYETYMEDWFNGLRKLNAEFKIKITNWVYENDHVEFDANCLISRWKETKYGNTRVSRSFIRHVGIKKYHEEWRVYSVTRVD
jgi:hypothetical protein